MPRCLVLLLVGLILSPTVSAEVTRWEIKSREPYVAGKAIGGIGPVERWMGVVHFAIDPALEANRGIVDLNEASKNSAGKVEFWSDFEMLVPVDRTKASGTLFYEVNNRGGKTAPRIIEGDADDFLLRQGFIVLWSGWIGEVLPGGGRLMMFAPEAKENGQPIRGIVRNELVVDKAVPRSSISHRTGLGSYRPSQAGLASATLTKREREADPRQSVPREQWKFVEREVTEGDRHGQLPVVELELEGGLQPGWIYEVVYEAEGPIVQGVGLAGIRDLVSHLKYDTSELNPLRAEGGKPLVSRALGFGTSQSGRCLRHFLWEGFNADERGRQVFDGLIPHVAGGGLGSFNHRFASPTRTNGQHEEHTFPADYFPFTYGDEQNLPADGEAKAPSDGILRRARVSKTVPKVMHTQSSSEYWHRSGSLVHTDPRGQRDAVIPPEVRIYSFGGTQHGTGNGLPAAKGNGQLPTNPGDYKPLLRALVVALDAWVKDGTEPPPSVYPKNADGTLVGWQESESGWRAIPGVNYPQVIHEPRFLDRGPDWLTKRIASNEPPRAIGHYVVKVPACGADGNERGTLNSPAITVPIATYTSWNLRDTSIGAAGELLGLQGSYIPFLRTRAEREKAADPRPAILERYRDFADYQQQYLAAAEKLLQDRYLLAEDLPRLKALTEKQRAMFEP